MADVAYGSLPFREQIAFLLGKVNVPTQGWTDVWRDQHDSMFMVAGAYKAQLLNDLRNAVQGFIDNGTPLAKFKKDFVAIANKHGWSYNGTPSWRSRVIYETNLSSSYAAGRYAQLTDPDLLSVRPYWVYHHMPGELHPRPEHLEKNGLAVRADSPWWQVWYPPNGWGCFPAETRVRCSSTLGQRFRYAGKLVELHTRRGNRLRVTPNHPILTARGWLAADLVEAGDQVIAAALDVDAALPRIVNDPQPPTRADELFETLAAEGLRIVPMTPDDFYGDARRGKGEVHIAGADRTLMHVVERSFRQRRGEQSFDRTLHRRVESADIAACAAQCAEIIADVISAKDSANGRLGDAQSLRDARLTRQVSAVERQHLALQIGVPCVGGSPRSSHQPRLPVGRPEFSRPPRFLGIDSTAPNDAVQPQHAAQSAAAGAQLFGELLQTGSGLIARDEVVGVDKFDWAGHVYDFTTDTGLIVADGFVVSNCQCWVSAESESSLRTKHLEVRQPPPIDYETKIVGQRSPSGPRMVHVPKGIDPGFDYAPGATQAERIRAELKQAATKLPPDLRVMVQTTLDSTPPPAPAAPKPATPMPTPQTLDEYLAEGKKLFGRFAPGGKTDVATFQQRVLDALRQVRAIDTPMTIPGHGEAAQRLRRVSRWIPDDWTLASDRAGPLGSRIVSNRSGYLHYRDGRGHFRLRRSSGDEITLHELMHRIQNVKPELDKLFQELHKRRTSGEALKAFRPREYARPDGYVSWYQGREYRFGNANGNALEVITMAFEHVLGGNIEKFKSILREDPEMVRFVLSVLWYSR